MILTVCGIIWYGIYLLLILLPLLTGVISNPDRISQLLRVEITISTKHNLNKYESSIGREQ